MGGAVPSRLSQTNWGEVSGGLSLLSETTDDNGEVVQVQGIDGSEPTEDYSIYELIRRSAIFHPRDFIVTDTYGKTLYKTRGIAKTVWGLEVLDVHLENEKKEAAAKKKHHDEELKLHHEEEESKNQGQEEKGPQEEEESKNESSSEKAGEEKEGGETKTDTTQKSEEEEEEEDKSKQDDKQEVEEHHPLHDADEDGDIWKETNAKVLLRVLPNHNFHATSYSKRSNRHHHQKKKLTTSYYDIYRSGIPTFDGQKPATLPELANPIQEPVFKVACVMVHNDSKMAICVKYGPPPIEEHLEYQNSSHHEANKKEEEQNHHLDDIDEFGSESHADEDTEDMFEQAANIAARRSRINSGDSDTLVVDDLPPKSPEAVAKVTIDRRSILQDQQQKQQRSRSNTDESSGIFSSGSSGIFSGTTTTSTGTGWSVRHLFDPNAKTRGMTKEEKRRAKYEQALEGMIDWDSLCFQIQETIQGDHQTSFISKDKVFDLLREERKKQKSNDNKNNNNNTDVSYEEWMKKSLGGVQNSLAQAKIPNLHLEDVKQSIAGTKIPNLHFEEMKQKSMEGVQSLTSNLTSFVKSKTTPTNNKTTTEMMATGSFDGDCISNNTNEPTTTTTGTTNNKSNDGGGGSNNWMSIGIQSFAKLGFKGGASGGGDNGEKKQQKEEEDGSDDKHDDDDGDKKKSDEEKDQDKEENEKQQPQEEEEETTTTETTDTTAETEEATTTMEGDTKETTEKEEPTSSEPTAKNTATPDDDNNEETTTKNEEEKEDKTKTDKEDSSTQNEKETATAAESNKEEDNNKEEEEVDNRPLVAFWSWQRKGHKMTMHLAKESDLALHVVMAIIISRGISIGT